VQTTNNINKATAHLESYQKLATFIFKFYMRIEKDWTSFTRIQN